MQATMCVLLPSTGANAKTASGFPSLQMPRRLLVEVTEDANVGNEKNHRGKRLVVLVGQKKAVAIAVRNASGLRRWSKLREWLEAGIARHHRGVSRAVL